MKSAVHTKEDVIQLLKPIFEKNGSRKAILFGSFAKGNQNSQSDIDILVDSGLHGMDFFGLLEDVCDTVDRRVEMIDVQDLQKNSGTFLFFANRGRIF
ncbi:MAG: nucleotidyltransferase domain-containing protein [Deltaproteobacteria bacterium]|nr:nucleotidyltransferase domain-containing protein [Deltaproteobacteria bacterium]